MLSSIWVTPSREKENKNVLSIVDTSTILASLQWGARLVPSTSTKFDIEVKHGRFLSAHHSGPALFSSWIRKPWAVSSPLSLSFVFFSTYCYNKETTARRPFFFLFLFFLYLWLSKRENDPELVPILYPVVCLDERKRWTMMAAGPSVAGRPAEVPGENYWDPVRCYRRRPVKVVHL